MVTSVAAAVKAALRVVTCCQFTADVHLLGTFVDI